MEARRVKEEELKRQREEEEKLNTVCYINYFDFTHLTKGLHFGTVSLLFSQLL